MPRPFTSPFAAVLMLILAATGAEAAGNPAEGAKLVAQGKCETCHHNRTMGDASAIYLRKDRRVTSWAKLKAQVSACNTQLNLGLFPDDEEHIAAFLNEKYYKLPEK